MKPEKAILYEQDKQLKHQNTKKLCEHVRVQSQQITKLKNQVLEIETISK